MLCTPKAPKAKKLKKSLRTQASKSFTVDPFQHTKAQRRLYMMDPRLHFVDLHQKQKNNNCLLILLTTFIFLAPQLLKKKRYWKSPEVATQHVAMRDRFGSPLVLNSPSTYEKFYILIFFYTFSLFRPFFYFALFKFFCSSQAIDPCQWPPCGYTVQYVGH